MRSLLLTSCLLICFASALAEEPPARFAGILQPGEEIVMVTDPMRDQVTVQLLSRPRRISENKPEGQGTLFQVQAVKEDYLLLTNAAGQVWLPFASVRLITATSDPLETRVTATFKRTPLQEFVRQLSQQMDVEIQLDGDALKSQGYTRNMAQDVQAANTPARQLLVDLLGRLPGLVITVHADHYRLTSRAVAEEDKAPVLQLVPPKQP